MSNVPVQVEPIKPDYGIDEKAMKDIASRLYRIDADQFLMMTDYENFSQNVLGPRSFVMCKLWKKILAGKKHSHGICKLTSMTSHEIRQLGAKVPTITEKFKLCRLNPPPEGKWLKDMEMLKRALDNEESFIRHLWEDRKAVEQYKEQGVIDFIDFLIRCHKNYCFLIRIHLEKE